MVGGQKEGQGEERKESRIRGPFRMREREPAAKRNRVRGRQRSILQRQRFLLESKQIYLVSCYCFDLSCRREKVAEIISPGLPLRLFRTSPIPLSLPPTSTTPNSPRLRPLLFRNQAGRLSRRQGEDGLPTTQAGCCLVFVFGGSGSGEDGQGQGVEAQGREGQGESSRRQMRPTLSLYIYIPSESQAELLGWMDTYVATLLLPCSELTSLPLLLLLSLSSSAPPSRPSNDRRR